MGTSNLKTSQSVKIFSVQIAIQNTCVRIICILSPGTEWTRGGGPLVQYMKWNNWLFRNYIRHIESFDHTNWCCAEQKCQATVEGFGTASLSKIVSSPNVNSVFEERRLRTYCLDSFLACSALQDMAMFSAFSWALCKNGIGNYTNETFIPMISILFYIFICRWTPFVTQTIHSVLCCYKLLVKNWFILNPTLDIW